LVAAGLVVGVVGLAAAGGNKFPATGQTTCWDTSGAPITCPGTGQDGDIQAGAALNYKDNGNGTITDNNTKLMWEKKSNDGTIHDKDNYYTWDDAFAVHIVGLNAVHFAGHTDWRLPNVKELQSILNYENALPAVSSAFNTGCVASSTVLTGSCTQGFFYFSSTSHAFLPGNAWGVFFSEGYAGTAPKNVIFHVRAVRGGL
jgi:Protein of unknown function (DUF1566)